MVTKPRRTLKPKLTKLRKKNPSLYNRSEPRSKPSIKKTFKKVMDSLKPGSRPKLNPDMVKTGPLTKNLRLKKKPKLNLKNKIPKVSDLLYRPKYDSKGNIIKPKAVPMSKRKPKKKKK